MCQSFNVINIKHLGHDSTALRLILRKGGRSCDQKLSYIHTLKVESWAIPIVLSLAEKYLQIGDWYIREYDAMQLSVSHIDGKTSMIYRTDGTIHYVPMTDFNSWELPQGEILQESHLGCDDVNCFRFQTWRDNSQITFSQLLT